jgi:hypothetical protein
MAAYYGLYICQFRPAWLGARVPLVAWLSAGTILVVGFLFANNWTLMLAPGVWKDLYTTGVSGASLNTGDRSLLPRFLHFIVGAFAVGGLGVVLLARTVRAADRPVAAAMEASGRRWFLAAGGLTMVIGFWFLFALPERVSRVFIGGGMLDSLVLTAGILLAVVAMAIVRKSSVLAAALTVASVFLMVVARHRVRQIMLQPHLQVNDLAVNPQWALFAAFVVVLLAGLATVGWMVAVFVRAKPSPTP